LRKENIAVALLKHQVTCALLRFTLYFSYRRCRQVYSIAFKYNVSEANIRHAILNYIYDDIIDDDPEKHLLIGFDNNANLLEILYNVINEQYIKVFHAMRCRDVLLPLLGR
jgi:hypothetical protein